VGPSQIDLHHWPNSCRPTNSAIVLLIEFRPISGDPTVFRVICIFLSFLSPFVAVLPFETHATVEEFSTMGMIIANKEHHNGDAKLSSISADRRDSPCCFDMHFKCSLLHIKRLTWHGIAAFFSCRSWAGMLLDCVANDLIPHLQQHSSVSSTVEAAVCPCAFCPRDA